MSDKPQENSKKYTVDEILAEFDNNRSAPEDTDDENISSSDNISEDEVKSEPIETESEIEPESESESLIENVSPANVFSVEKNDLSVQELFSQNEAEETDLQIPDNDVEITAEVWSESNEDSAEIADAALYTEELKEDVVPENEIVPKSSENVNTDIIIADEDEVSQKNGSETDRSDPDTSDTSAPEKDNKEAEIATADPEVSCVENAESDISSSEDASGEKDTKENSKFKSFIMGIIPWKGDSILEIIRKVIFIAAVAVFIGAGIMLLSTLVQSHRAVLDSDKNKEIIMTTAATTIDSDGNVITIAPTEDEEIEHSLDIMKYYKEISENVIGFIQMDGCDIYQPVVQGDDNEYYLTHTYYDEANKGGSIFADYRCRFEEDYTSPNIVLYGHNQEDGTMFGNLQYYKQNVEFYAANPTITFNTEYGIGTYLIYGFFVTNALEKQDSNGEVFHYHDYIEVMNDEYTFNWYLSQVQERNQIISPVDVQFGDQLLCLSTCSNEFSNSRFVVFARKLREGESVSDYDFSMTTLNPNARGVDWNAILSGETTAATTEEITETEESTVTTVPEETDEEASETTKKKKKKTTTEASEEETASEKSETPAETTVPLDESDGSESASQTVTAETSATTAPRQTSPSTSKITTESTTAKSETTTTTTPKTTAETSAYTEKETTQETPAETSTDKSNTETSAFSEEDGGQSNP